MSQALLFALALLGVIAYGIFSARDGGRVRFRAEALGVKAEGEFETKSRSDPLALLESKRRDDAGRSVPPSGFQGD